MLTKLTRTHSYLAPRISMMGLRAFASTPATTEIDDILQDYKLQVGLQVFAHLYTKQKLFSCKYYKLSYDLF